MTSEGVLETNTEPDTALCAKVKALLLHRLVNIAAADYT
jgi:hypothetical protein